MREIQLYTYEYGWGGSHTPRTECRPFQSLPGNPAMVPSFRTSFHPPQASDAVPGTKHLCSVHPHFESDDGGAFITNDGIARLTSKRHNHVLRDADKMLKELGLGTDLKFEASYKDSTGRALRCLKLPKRETKIPVSGYSVELRVPPLPQSIHSGEARTRFADMS